MVWLHLVPCVQVHVIIKIKNLMNMTEKRFIFLCVLVSRGRNTIELFCLKQVAIMFVWIFQFFTRFSNIREIIADLISYSYSFLLRKKSKLFLLVFLFLLNKTQFTFNEKIKQSIYKVKESLNQNKGDIFACVMQHVNTTDIIEWNISVPFVRFKLPKL